MLKEYVQFLRDHRSACIKYAEEALDRSLSLGDPQDLKDNARLRDFWDRQAAGFAEQIEGLVVNAS